MKHPNKIDWVVYSIFRRWWNPIFKKNKRLSIALAREINSYWAKQNRFIGDPVDHRHDFYLDSEVVFTDDGEPQPRSSIFLECFAGDKHRMCPFILRDYEIVDYINSLLDRIEHADH